MANGSDNIETQETSARVEAHELRNAPPHDEKRPGGGGQARTALFGAFALDLDTGELRKAGTRVRLQNKPFQILRALIHRHGEVVTRDELRRHVWPDDTFVDFESGLNTAANRLRLALNDSAENPRYIETLPRVGYRFIGPLQFQTQGAVSEAPAHTETVAADPAAERHERKWRRPVVVISLGLLAATALALIIWRRRAPPPVTPLFQQLTFRKGIINNARFTVSGEVVFSAEWDGDSSKLYLMNLVSPEARQLPFGAATLASVSPSSEVSFVRRIPASDGYAQELAAAALYGGAPRVVTRGVRFADRTANGETCITRRTAHGEVLEFPEGKVVYETSGWLGMPRVSPDGSLVAITEHPLREDDAGRVLIAARDGKVRRLSDGWASLTGLAWSPRGNEVWFSAAGKGINREIYAVDLQSHLRRVAAMPATLDLFDISPSGTVLIGRSTPRLSLFAGNLKTVEVKDISWLDWSRIAGISADGKNLLFDESGEGGGSRYTVYLHRRDSGTTERIGDGRALDISPDGAWILTTTREPSSNITLISADDAKARTITAPGFIYQAAYFVGRSRQLLVQLTQTGSPKERWYLQNLDTGAFGDIPGFGSPGFPGRSRPVISPSGTSIAAWISEGKLGVLRLSDNHRIDISTSESTFPVAWPSENTLAVALVHGDGVHGGRPRIEELDIASGKRRLVTLLPEQIGLVGGHQPFDLMMVSADLSTFAFSAADKSANLFAAQGWS